MTIESNKTLGGLGAILMAIGFLPFAGVYSGIIALVGRARFATTGLVFLIGAILTIVLIGFVLLWVSLLLLAVSFFTIPTQLSQQPTQQPVSPPQTQQ
ncbi:MAG TPA: hypothetical protein VJ529_01555 [Candidatus Bathyarchaeia archaeon]|nr:hypothetical protein [Candidatus Bathyarchaeia archaeon]